MVIRTSFDARDHLVRDFPGTFSVPSHLEKHMMVVADLSTGDRDAIEGGLHRRLAVAGLSLTRRCPPPR